MAPLFVQIVYGLLMFQSILLCSVVTNNKT